MDDTESGRVSPRDLLAYALKALSDLCKIEKITIDRPASLASDVIKVLAKHFAYGSRTKIRLPALAVCTVYREAAGNVAWGRAVVSDPAVSGAGAGLSGAWKCSSQKRGAPARRQRSGARHPSLQRPRGTSTARPTSNRPTRTACRPSRRSAMWDPPRWKRN